MNKLKEFLRGEIAKEDKQIEPYTKQLKEIEEQTRNIKIKLNACESRKFAYVNILEEIEKRIP